MICPHCKKYIGSKSEDGLSQRAFQELGYMRASAKERGGYIYEGARPAYESGKYVDSTIAELLAAGAIKPHNNPAKGWVVMDNF